jgi:hypothetical protein
MPESPTQNHVLSATSETSEDSAEAGETVAFLPPLVSRILIAGWILLFAGRWLVVQGMTAAGLIAPELVDRLDENVLGRCYLLLLSVTLVTLIVRIVLGRNSRPYPAGSQTDYIAPGRPVSAVEGTVKAESSDRGGKQA